MDRLAKRIFASPDSPFTAFADRQRMERLEGCRELQRILVACQAEKVAIDEGKDATSLEVADIPQSKSGARIARFFRWDSVNADDDAQQQSDVGPSSVLSEAASAFYEGNDNSSDKGQGNSKSIAKKSRFSKDCAIETHELWACRALALGCGNHLTDLRRCLDDNNQKISQASGEMQYHNEARKTCRDIQVDMATCVNKNAAELDARNKAAKAAAKAESSKQ